jgi:hypothetical protein
MLAIKIQVLINTIFLEALIMMALPDLEQIHYIVIKNIITQRVIHQQRQQYPDAGIPSSATNNPNIEDINKDNTLSETENYYQYKISKFLHKI